MHGPVRTIHDPSVMMDISIPTLTPIEMIEYRSECQKEYDKLEDIPPGDRSRKVQERMMELAWKLKELKGRITGQQTAHQVRQGIRRRIKLKYIGNCADCKKEQPVNEIVFLYYDHRKIICLCCGERKRVV